MQIGIFHHALISYWKLIFLDDSQYPQVFLKNPQLLRILKCCQGSFTNYVYKARLVGGPKMSNFCQCSYHRKCQGRRVGGQKKQNLVNVVCERPLSHLLLITELKQNIKNKAISGIQFEQKVRIYSHEDFFQRNIFSNHSIVALIDSTTVKGSI